MSEQIEIEVGANLSKFNAGMANIRNSVQRVAGNIARMDFAKSEASMGRLKEASKQSGREANTLKTIFAQIANAKIDSRSLSDFREIFKELVRIIKEFGPLLTLAMNTADGAIRKFLNTNMKLLTDMERLSATFLVFRKVLPVRLWRVFTVNTQRLSSAIVGMSNDIIDFAKFGKNAFTSVKDVLSKLFTSVTKTKGAFSEVNDMFSGQQTKKATSNFAGLGSMVKQLGENTLKSIKQFRSSDTVLGKLGQTMKGFSVASLGVSKVSFGITRGFAKMIANSAILRGGFRMLLGVVKNLHPAKMALKVATMTLGGAFTALVGTSRGLLRVITRVGGATSRFGFRTLNIGARQAIAPIKAVAGGIRSIVSNPIRTAGKALGLLKKSGGIAKVAITGLVGVFTLLSKVISSTADGAVSSFNKNFRKAMAELPNNAQGSFDKVRGEIMTLQNELGFTADQALPALQQAFRKGFDQNNAVGAVKQAMLLAKTGAVDLEGSIDILGNSMRAFSREGLSASEASDALYRATRGTDVNVGSLSDSIKRIGPDLSSAGLGFNEFLGAMKTLTQQGRLGASAIGEIQSLTASLVSPSESATKAMQELGLNFTEADMAGRGLSGILEDVRKATGGNAEAMAQILGGQENLNTALLLGAQNGTRLSKNLDEIRNSTGGVASQADKMDTAFSRAMKKISARVETLKVELGDMLEPLLAKLGEFVAEWTKGFTKAMKIALRIFEGGQLGEVLFLAVSIGLRKAMVAIMNFGAGTQRAIVTAFANGVKSWPKIVGEIIPNILARLGKIGMFFVELGGQFIKAFEVPLAYLMAGIKKAIEEAREAVEKLPFVGDDNPTKARAFKVILQQELKNTGKLSDNIKDFADQGYKNAEAIIKRTDGAISTFISGQVEAVKEGFAEGAKSFELPPSVLRDQQKLGDILTNAVRDVEKAGESTAKMAQDATLKTGVAVKKAIGIQGRGGTGGGGGSEERIIASSLASIGGGGGVFGSMTGIAKETLNVAKQSLEQQKLQTRQLGEMEAGKVMM